MAICRGFFVLVSKSFCVYDSKSFLHGRKPFLYVSKTFLFARFSLLAVFLFVIIEAVIGHRAQSNIFEVGNVRMLRNARILFYFYSIDYWQEERNSVVQVVKEMKKYQLFYFY